MDRPTHATPRLHAAIITNHPTNLSFFTLSLIRSQKPRNNQSGNFETSLQLYVRP